MEQGSRSPVFASRTRLSTYVHRPRHGDRPTQRASLVPGCSGSTSFRRRGVRAVIAYNV